MRRGRDFLTALGEKLDIPREALPCGFALALSGDGEMTVWGCRRILSYNEGEIVLLVGKRTLRVCGAALFCSAFGSGAVTVTGKIDSLAFLEE